MPTVTHDLTSHQWVNLMDALTPVIVRTTSEVVGGWVTAVGRTEVVVSSKDAGAWRHRKVSRAGVVEVLRRDSVPGTFRRISARGVQGHLQGRSTCGKMVS